MERSSTHRHDGNGHQHPKTTNTHHGPRTHATRAPTSTTSYAHPLLFPAHPTPTFPSRRTFATITHPPHTNLSADAPTIPAHTAPHYSSHSHSFTLTHTIAKTQPRDVKQLPHNSHATTRF